MKRRTTLQYSGQLYSFFFYIEIYLKVSVTVHITVLIYPGILAHIEIVAFFTSNSPDTYESDCIVKSGHKSFRHEFYKIELYLNIQLEMLHIIQGSINAIICSSTMSAKLEPTSGKIF
jgi:hypothetical protein